MSLDDETPTQYFGPGAVEVTIHGKQVRMTQQKYYRLTEKPGALTDEEMLNAKIDELSLADILAEANKQHRAGCASSRHRPCTCDYLAQWDSAGEQCVRAYDQYAAKIYGPGVMVMPDGMVEDFIRSANLASATMPIVISQSEYDKHGLRVLNDPAHRWVPGDQLRPLGSRNKEDS